MLHHNKKTMECIYTFIIVVVLVGILPSNANALKCYSCTATSEGADQTCITDPEKVEQSPIVNCNKKYCISTRVEYIEPKDKVQSMSRGCVDKTIFTNQVIEDATYRTYYRACRTDLCNGGSGKGASGGGVIGNTENAAVLLVPGIKNNNDRPLSTGLYIFAAVILIINV